MAWQDGRRESLRPDEMASGSGADPMDFSHHAHRRAIEDFLDALERARPPRVTGWTALEVHRLIDALLAG